ncbi:nuclease-related domain-containing protein [Pseudolysinimonas yzui]|uniref:NERD domain-containing protein n=1 Tax=Pseudolysinimonas yzui TaxID=2708254 RepID=A0A8J3M004_9MICO|nr:nuclease-related domain-containing protein [Pseudolysinimonas yzui]GHF11770.1 hypothetical protein GCM10011600_11400 [Pseudolysinimonas yzui]
MGNAGELTHDLAQRAPGHSLIEKLLDEWNQGRIHFGDQPDTVEIDEDARGWYWGVLGEQRVAATLSTLGPEWTVLHSVPVGAGNTDIDHVVIGPAGVFTLNTKYSPVSNVWTAGRGLMVNGESRAHYLRSSMAELQRASTALSQAAGFAVPVFSALVFVDPASLTVKAPPGWDGTDLHVVSERGLLPLLTRRREMSDEQLTTVMDAALRAETWHRSPQPSRPGTHLTQEFQALRDAVGPALETTRPLAAASSRPLDRRPARTHIPSRRPVRSSRRRRRSIGEELFRLVVPFVGLLAAWYYLASIFGK